jgi:hypothetical protein
LKPIINFVLEQSELPKDQEAFDRLLKIELKLNSEENLLGSAGHIEITGTKK